MHRPNRMVAMVVEDHAFQRSVLVHMLRAMNVDEVLEAEHGRQALEQLRETQVDIVVCDLDMPEMDGIELMRHLEEANHHPSVIICSAREPSLVSSVEKMALAYGVRLLGIVEKPVRRPELEALMARHVASEPARNTPAPSPFRLDEILQGVANREFIPYFQPQVAIESGRVIGAEALARWRHPQQGLIPPHAFIPLLEQSGQIGQLTLQMLEHAAQACSRWHREGMQLTVSVNLALASLTDTGLVDRVTHIAGSAGLRPSAMILEITETTAMTEVATALEILTRLRMRGFALSVDDYGTGFSSLKQLTRIPFTELKIDQSFVTGCTGNPATRAIVESSVEMARRLNLKSVAEGVETQEDWDTLAAMSCDIGQGYFIAKPLPEADFLQFVQEQRSRPPAAPLTLKDQ